MENELKQLGLTDNEVRVYLALLEIGEHTAGPIVMKLGIHRQLVYDALGGLEKKNMVTRVIKGNRNHFRIADPENILTGIKAKEQAARRIIPGILALAAGQARGQEIKVYEGEKAYRELTIGHYERMEPENETQVFFSMGQRFLDIMVVGGGLKRLEKIEQEKKLASRFLFSEQWRGKLGIETHPFRTWRFAAIEHESPITAQIWPDGVSLISSGSDVFVIDIKNMDFRAAYLNYFEIFWRLGRS